MSTTSGVVYFAATNAALNEPLVIGRIGSQVNKNEIFQNAGTV